MSAVGRGYLPKFDSVDNKAVILRNHGLLTTGYSVDEMAALTHDQVGSPIACYRSFQPLWDWITREEPDLFE